MNSAKTLNVWIVDDDASIRWVLERALRQGGMQTDGLRAMRTRRSQRCAARSPDVLVTDIRMPGRSGLDLLEEIRSKRPRLPVIVMTAHSDLESAVAAYQGGAFEYLPKPFDIDQAVELVRRAAAQGHRSETSASRVAPHPGDARPRAGDAGGVPRHRPPVALEHDRADHRRVGHGQGTGGARAASSQPARGQAVHRAQHLGVHRRPARVGAVRPREGCVHGRDGAASRALRAGRRRHAVPRRDRRHVAGAADAAAARAGRGRVLSRRRAAAGEGGRARDRGDAPGSRDARARKACSARTCCIA